MSLKLSTQEKQILNIGDILKVLTAIHQMDSVMRMVGGNLREE